MLLFLNAITHNNTDFTKEAVGNEQLMQSF